MTQSKNKAWPGRSVPLVIGHLLLAIALAACASAPVMSAPTLLAPVSVVPQVTSSVAPTPLPTREAFAEGTDLSYVTQTGDTVPTIAIHFNTSPELILAANPTLPPTTTLGSGHAITVPAYYFSFGGPTFKIIPDSEFVYGAATLGFDLKTFVAAQPGYLKQLSVFASGRQRTSAEAIQYIAENYSINPKLLLALLEWRSHALTRPSAPTEVMANPLEHAEAGKDFYRQLTWAAEQMSIGYYGWRSGALVNISFKSDGFFARGDMYQNAATIGLHHLFAQLYPHEEFDAVAGPDGFAATYYALWGNPFANPALEVIPAELTQPALDLPFAPNQQWTFTGGPHPAWGENPALPWAALDFAPAGVSECNESLQWVTASAPGLVVRSDDSIVMLDLDRDGYEQTGWVIFYYHLAGQSLYAPGRLAAAGDLIGRPSCEGGRATGTHVHFARKFNGEWIPANGLAPGVAAFELGGWATEQGEAPYQGKLVIAGAWVEACTCSTAANRVYWVRR